MQHFCIFISQNPLQNNLGLPDNTEKMMKFDNGGSNETMNGQTYLNKYIYTDNLTFPAPHDGIKTKTNNETKNILSFIISPFSHLIYILKYIYVEKLQNNVKDIKSELHQVLKPNYDMLHNFEILL